MSDVPKTVGNLGEKETAALSSIFSKTKTSPPVQESISEPDVADTLVERETKALSSILNAMEKRSPIQEATEEWITFATSDEVEDSVNIDIVTAKLKEAGIKFKKAKLERPLTDDLYVPGVALSVKVSDEAEFLRITADLCNMPFYPVVEVENQDIPQEEPDRSIANATNVKPMDGVGNDGNTKGSIKPVTEEEEPDFDLGDVEEPVDNLHARHPGYNSADDDYFEYLDELRISGVTNMYGAGAYLEKDFGLSKREARTILTKWMETFSDRHPHESRYRKVKPRVIDFLLEHGTEATIERLLKNT